MKIHELLDRFEKLYPNNSIIMDMRRAYIDKDLNSIFRIVETNNKEDLRKVVCENNYQSLWRLLEKYCDTRLSASLKYFYIRDIKIAEDCFSQGQVQSKAWLVKELVKLNLDLGTVFLCAGWYGTLATLLFENHRINVDKIRSFDIDESCWKVAEVFNKPWVMSEWRFKASTKDIMDLTYDVDKYNTIKTNGDIQELTETSNTIINTSCEHIQDFDTWYNKIPSGKILILQSNNYIGLPEHVNCSKTLKDFNNKTPMQEVLFQGELYLDKYSRYMRIGIK
jgi:hypothetical protein